MGREISRSGLATPAEAAAYLGRAVSTLRKWRSIGEGPKFVGRGHGVRYRWSDLDAWIDENTQDPSGSSRSRRRT